MNRCFIGILAIFCMGVINAGDLIKLETQCSSSKTNELCTVIWDTNPSKEEFEDLLVGSDPNAKSYDYAAEWDPLSVVIVEGRFDFVKPLIKAGADPKKALLPSIGYMAALHYGYEGCCSNGHKTEGHFPFCFRVRAQAKLAVDREEAFTEALEALIKAKADVDDQIDDLPTALMMALEQEDEKTANLLIDNGANADFVVSINTADIRAMKKKKSLQLKHKRLKNAAITLKN